MPHFIVKCSDNIREEADLPGLFAKVNPTLNFKQNNVHALFK
ncbi:5-carboxymethyl-2-hydroxymuconate delta-isomerase [Shigella sonnei]|nr:hypothetical protein [Shigella sonnei]SIZ64232.1 5-carboxymethyl-2-hydroxymuconate delta-isomerase [Shigella sonnei]SIZ84073.1 5-carboxymethyl-2-hydroxymuconate delta-isomerase [Shigella sonnei]SJJ31258.1 5-carboxymethyl-2-hydroxymuconate delta-isomerase [Shigella sonnei]